MNLGQNRREGRVSVFIIMGLYTKELGRRIRNTGMVNLLQGIENARYTKEIGKEERCTEQERITITCTLTRAMPKRWKTAAYTEVISRRTPVTTSGYTRSPMGPNTMAYGVKTYLRAGALFAGWMGPFTSVTGRMVNEMGSVTLRFRIGFHTMVCG